jgi:fibronectin-binding autotransporter adhesin
LKILAPGVFDPGGFQQTVAALSGDGKVKAAPNFISTLIVNGPLNTTFDGVMSGPMKFTKAGAGTLTLTKKQTYTNDTNINGTGGIKLGIDDCLPTNNLSLSGTLDLNDHNQTLGDLINADGTITNTGPNLRNLKVTTGSSGPTSAISGKVVFVKQNAGTFVISGNNTYTGATNVTGGTLSLGASNVLPDDTTVNVSLNATLDLHGVFDETIAGLEGMGEVSGTIDETTLNLSVPANVTKTFDGTLTGVIELHKKGAGTQVLSKRNSYSRGTSVDAGTLTITTPFAQAMLGGTGTDDVLVKPGATLNGTGYVSSDVYLQGGKLAGTLRLGGTLTNESEVGPGGSAGTITVDGSYTQAAAGTLKVEIGGAQANMFDRLLIAGNATLDGTLEISLINGFVPQVGDSFVILTTNARQGQFATVNGTVIAGGLVFVVQYTNTSVKLVVQPAAGVPALSPWGTVLFALLLAAAAFHAMRNGARERRL